MAVGQKYSNFISISKYYYSLCRFQLLYALLFISQHQYQYLSDIVKAKSKTPNPLLNLFYTICLLPPFSVIFTYSVDTAIYFSFSLKIYIYTWKYLSNWQDKRQVGDNAPSPALKDMLRSYSTILDLDGSSQSSPLHLLFKHSFSFFFV